MPEPGAMESEFGVPIPGRILPESEWARTAIKRLPPPGPLDWSAIFGRTAPVILELGCGNGRFTLLSALSRPEFDHVAIDVLPVVIRYATRRANQRGLHNVRFAVKDAETFMAAYVAESSVAEVHLYHPQPYPDRRQAHSAAGHATVPGRRPPGPPARRAVRGPDRQPRVLGVHRAGRLRLLRLPRAPRALARRPRRPLEARDPARSRGLRIFRGTGLRRDDITRKASLALAESLPAPNFRGRGPWCDLDRDDRP